MQIDTAESWGHLQDLLFAETWNQDLERYRSAWAFRGMSDIGQSLDTTLMRLGGDFAYLERNLLRNFIKYAHRNVVQRDSLWHWLSLAQHHGLPTRLLDWTHSPLVAAHFATQNTEEYDRDAVVWCIDYERTHRLLPDELRLALTEERANTFTTELLDEHVPTLEQLDRLADEPYLLFYEPPSMDERIVNQFALFSVIADSAMPLDGWIQRHSDLCRKVVIPAGLKWEIRDKLDQCNITERILLSGLDGLSRWLRRHYSPRDPIATRDSKATRQS